MSVHRARPSAPSSRPGDLERDPLGVLRYRAVPDGLCDFCGDTLTGFWRRFECHNFTRQMHGSTEEVPVHFLGFWGACLLCASYVERHDWRGLLDRVIPAHEARSGGMHAHLRAVLRSEIAATYLQLERALTGRSFTASVAA